MLHDRLSLQASRKTFCCSYLTHSQYCSVLTASYLCVQAPKSAYSPWADRQSWWATRSMLLTVFGLGNATNPYTSAGALFCLCTLGNRAHVCQVSALLAHAESHSCICCAGAVTYDYDSAFVGSSPVTS